MIGGNPANWRTKLPTYGEVVYRRLWPGIDLHLRGEDGQLKYEFHLAPGADASRIRLAYRGQERLSLGRSGELLIETTLGRLRDSRPVSYQTAGGKRVAVESRFVLGRRGAYGFAVGAYDRRYPLVIDPGLVYSTYLGGTSEEEDRLRHRGGRRRQRLRDRAARGSADFPTTAGAFDTTYNGGDDAFVTKLDASGAALVYSTYLGGSGYDWGDGVAVDGAGQRLRDGSNQLGQLPDDRRVPSTRPTTAAATPS